MCISYYLSVRYLFLVSYFSYYSKNIFYLCVCVYIMCVCVCVCVCVCINTLSIISLSGISFADVFYWPVALLSILFRLSFE